MSTTTALTARNDRAHRNRTAEAAGRRRHGEEGGHEREKRGSNGSGLTDSVDRVRECSQKGVGLGLVLGGLGWVLG